MRKVLVAVLAVLLSGCASEEPTTDAEPVDGTQSATVQRGDGSAGAGAALHPISFEAGAFEGTLEGSATFQPTDTCFPQCGPDSDQAFDLTSIIPANAPVELVIELQGGNAFPDLELIDAAAVFMESDGEQLAALLSRGETGQVILHLYNGGFLINGFPPGPQTTTWTATSVVRADRLVPYLPASLPLQQGESVELRGDDIEEAILIDPEGGITRDAQEPFVLTANGTKGEHTILLIGDDTARVHGPNVTMQARRIEIVFGDPQPLASGQESSWTFTVDQAPFQVGVRLYPGDGPTPFPVGTQVRAYQLGVTSPTGAKVVDAGGSCQPSCGGFLVFGSSSFMYGSEPLTDQLPPGSYEATVTYDGNGMVGQSWYRVIA